MSDERPTPQQPAPEELGRIPAHPTPPPGFDSAPRRTLVMTPHLAAIGGLLAFFMVVLTVVVLPTATYDPPPSENWLPLTDEAADGRAVYMANGCLYCHSGFTRPQDVLVGQFYLYPRISEPGDFAGTDQAPQVMGSERTGPDLSQEGGMHPDGWHEAHYYNPRNVNPLSIMPQFNFLTEDELSHLVAFNQESGGKEAVLRAAAVEVGNNLMAVNGAGADPMMFFPDLVNQLTSAGEYKADGSGMDKSPSGMPWMAVWMVNSFERGYWLTPDPLPVTQQNLTRGKQIYLERCSGCHGPKGDGFGSAQPFLTPTPFNFTDTSMMGANGFFASDGMYYHRILTGGPGTAMENFGTRLSVEDTWRVVQFLRTIPNGSLEDQGSVVTPDMFQPWSPPPPLQNYIDSHPISDGPGNITATDPFGAAAHWIAPGMGPADTIMIGGKLPMTQQRLADLIRSVYMQKVQKAYDDAENRGEDLPPREQIMDTTGITFHSTSG